MAYGIALAWITARQSQHKMLLLQYSGSDSANPDRRMQNLVENIVETKLFRRGL